MITICDRAVRAAPCRCGCAGHLTCPCHGTWIRSGHKCSGCDRHLGLDDTSRSTDGEIVHAGCVR